MLKPIKRKKRGMKSVWQHCNRRTSLKNFSNSELHFTLEGVLTLRLFSNKFLVNTNGFLNL